MRSSLFMSLALFAALGTSTPVPDNAGIPSANFPIDGTDNIPALLQMTTSLGVQFTIENGPPEFRLGLGGKQKEGVPGWWWSSLSYPVCPAFCLSPATDINLRNEWCTGFCSGTGIRPWPVYVTRDAVTHYIGSFLYACESGVCQGLSGLHPIDLLP
ncbi:hypothetical protein MMC07_000631 [Pseudocyphellaria aurata]|nr:hypothetical protein [Pseudocyphellaria aurata]